MLTGHGGPEVLQVEERPDPPVGPGEVRIAVKAAGINFADTMARVGLYPDAPKPPCVLGYEVAGEVESVGEGVDRVSGRRPGDGRHPLRRPGASWSPCPRTRCCRCRSRSASSRARRSRSTTATAYAALVIMGGLREGERVLIHAAAGGVGISATQIARNARRRDLRHRLARSKHDAIREQGVDHAIDYRSQDFEQEVRRITGGEGVDLDHGRHRARPPSARTTACCAPAAGWSCTGSPRLSTERQAQHPGRCCSSLARMPLATMPWWKSLAVMNENKGVFGLNMLELVGPGGRPRPRDRAADARTSRPGELEPVVAEAFPFERAGDAHRFIAERRNIGKVVLFPS